MRTIPPAQTTPFPQQLRADLYSEGYREGLRDGEKWANTSLVWLGIGIGVLLAASIVLAVLAWR